MVEEPDCYASNLGSIPGQFFGNFFLSNLANYEKTRMNSIIELS